MSNTQQCMPPPVYDLTLRKHSSARKPSYTELSKPFQIRSTFPLCKSILVRWRCLPGLDKDLRCSSMKQERGYRSCSSWSQQRHSNLSNAAKHAKPHWNIWNGTSTLIYTVLYNIIYINYIIIYNTVIIHIYN